MKRYKRKFDEITLKEGWETPKGVKQNITYEQFLEEIKNIEYCPEALIKYTACDIAMNNKLYGSFYGNGDFLLHGSNFNCKVEKQNIMNIIKQDNKNTICYYTLELKDRGILRIKVIQK